jgi:extracellular elastinolytic metalloproteinase
LLENLEPRRLFNGTTTSSLNSDDGLKLVYTPPTQMLENLKGGFLTKAATGKAIDIARSYLADHANELGLNATDISTALVTNQYTDTASGVTHIYMMQTHNGLPVINANLSVHLTRDNRIINASSSFVVGLNEAKPAAQAPVPTLPPQQALSHAAGALGRAMTKAPGIAKKSSTHFELTSSEMSLDAIPMKAEYVPTGDGGVTLAWGLVVRPPKMNDDWYDMAVDGATGALLFANNWTDHLAQYDVFPLPVEAPNDGSRSIVADPSDPTASPFGWHDTNGVAGPESTLTLGNNASAYTDTDANNSPDLNSSPDGGASLNFDFPLDLTQAPSAYRPAAVTNLFYWVNILHDLHYHYGFTEAAGNFQVNNYGRGGSGGDQVLGEAQDGSGTNNANFSTPPDGSSGRMQMYIWTNTTPSRDGDFDATVMAHEFGHGVSNRLTGGPANANALDATQSGGMGEGWSDFWSLMVTEKPSDVANLTTGSFGVATYVKGQSNTGGGLRAFPYSYNMSSDPLTIDDYGSGTNGAGRTRSTEVHATGTIWCSALWDMTILLQQKYGFDSNLYTGYTAAAGPGHAGNKLAWQLVLDAMKLQPANPTFAQARDAILQADQVLTGGTNQNEIWQAFARRGMGFSFNSGSNSSSLSVVAATNVPPVDPVITAQTPLSAQTQVTPVSSMSFTFSEAIDPTSFSLGSDVTFVGPGSVDLSGSLTGFAFSNGNKTLTVNFAPTSVFGTYTMSIGPNINAADNGHPMDQNMNGTTGEAADKYTGTFVYNTLIADVSGYPYQAGQWAFENISLTPGGAGVTSVLANNDDSTVAINLGTNTFNLYGTVYTGSGSTSPGTLNICDNGFVSFAVTGSASTAPGNTDFTSPIAARFAPLWDDWYTQVDANDQVLYRFDDLNADGVSDRLVVEWHGVHSTSGGSGVTFQAILQLNTGSTPGVMIGNYVAIQSDNAGVSNGGSSSVGIKDTGTPPTGGRRLLVTQDNGSFPWLGDGKAIRIATDWTPPTVSSSAFNYLSGPQTLQFSFSENVAASLSKADLTLTNTTLNQTISLSSVTYNYNTATNTATFTLPNGLLPDGNYTATLSSSGVTDSQWNSLAGTNTKSFFVLTGDANHDKSVDLTDFTSLAANFNTSGKDYSQGNFDYDAAGNVDLTDFTLLAAHFNQSLPADGSFAASAVVATTAKPAAAPAANTSIFSASKIDQASATDALVSLV